MNGIRVNRLHEFEAKRSSPASFCGPVRMHRAARPCTEGMLPGSAWRHAIGERALWRRALVTGSLALVLVGALGEPHWFATGAAVCLGSLFVQCWHFAETTATRNTTRWN